MTAFDLSLLAVNALTLISVIWYNGRLTGNLEAKIDSIQDVLKEVQENCRTNILANRCGDQKQ